MYTEQVVLGLLGLINVVALFVMAKDKAKSARGNDADRTPEGILFFLAASFGAIGIYTGMFLFRHKTRKWYFIFGIPLLIAENLATLYVIQQFLTVN